VAGSPVVASPVVAPFAGVLLVAALPLEGGACGFAPGCAVADREARCAFCWAACRAASSASPNPAGVWPAGVWPGSVCPDCVGEAEPVADWADANRGGAAAADKGFSMIVLIDDAERHGANVPPGSEKKV
jgi:hypothetical protein